MKITFPDGRELDTTGSLPFTFGDWRILEKRGVRALDFERGTFTVEHLFQVVWRVVEKQGKGFTETDVEGLPFTGELTAGIFRELAGDATDGKPGPT